jgi:hypothetical protein
VTKKKAAIVAERVKIKICHFVRVIARICHVALALNQACHVPGCADASIVPTLTKIIQSQVKEVQHVLAKK